MSIIQLRHPWQVEVGQVIVLNPVKSVAVRWTVVDRRRVDCTHVGLDYETENGDEGLIVLDENQRVAVAAEPEPLMTAVEREQAYERLSDDDCGHIAAHLLRHQQAALDDCLRALDRYQHGLLEVA